MILEVTQIWGDLRLDTRHFRADHGVVTAGSSIGWRWNFLGVDMGFVPLPLTMVLPYTPPMWSEVHAQPTDDFYLGDDRALFTYDVLEERWLADTDAGQVEVGEEPVVITVDGVVFLGRMVQRGKRIARKGVEPDYPMAAIFSFVAFLGLMFGTILYFSPAPPEAEMVDLPDRFVELALQTEKKVEKKTVVKADRPKKNKDAGEGKRAKKKAGKRGRTDADKKKASGASQAERDRRIADNAGVLGWLNNNGQAAGFGGGIDPNLTRGLGSYTGPKGVSYGTGLADRGDGLGGGGRYEQGGGLGTQGIGGGNVGYGADGGDLGPPGAGDGTIAGMPEEGLVIGCLSSSIVDEVVKRRINALRACYQHALQRQPSLMGKVVTRFVIAKDGSVSTASIKSSSLNHDGVHRCLEGQFLRMQFPACKQGIVIVSYPLLFSPG